MSEVLASFDSYRVEFWSHSSQFRSIIHCYQGPKAVGKLVFVDNDKPLPPNQPTAASPSAPPPTIHFHVRHFTDIMTLVREEKPLLLNLNYAKGVGMVGTEDREPTGEDEGP